MGYRYSDKPVKPEDMLPKYSVRNGATLHLEFDCYYWTPESVNPNFYYGGPDCKPMPWSEFYPELWKPQPKFPDMRYIPSDFTEIDLPTEGYDSLVIKFDDSDISQHLTTELGYDETETNVAHCVIMPNLPQFEDKPKETRFTVFASSTSSGMQDALCRGILAVLPGPPYTS